MYIGNNVLIDDKSSIISSIIDDNCVIEERCYLGENLKIPRNVWIKNNSSFINN